MNDETMIKSAPENANEPDDWSTFDFSTVENSRKNRKPFFAKKSDKRAQKTAPKVVQISSKSARVDAELTQKFELERAQKRSENFAENNAKIAADMTENELDVLANSIKNDAEILAKILPENRGQKSKKSRAKTAGIAYFLAVGFFAGAAIWALNLFVNYAFLRPAFCADVNVSKLCATSNIIAFSVASVVVGALVFSLFFARKISHSFLTTLAAIVTFGALFLLISGVENDVFAALISGVFGALIVAFFARIFASKNALFASALATIFAVAFWLFARA